MRHRRLLQLGEPGLGDLCVGDARIGVAPSLLDVAAALEPVEQARDPRGSQHDTLRQVDPPHCALFRTSEVQQHLVVVQRQAVVALQPRRQLAGDRGVGAQEPDPGFEHPRRGEIADSGCLHCALKGSGQG